MKCPRCGQPVPAGGSFCAHCGLAQMPSQPGPAPAARVATAPSAGVASLQTDFDSQRRRNLAIMAAVVSLALVVAVALGVRAFGGLRATGGTPDDPLLVRNARSGAGVLEAKSEGPPPTLAKEGVRELPKQMPADVFAWLKHLEKCEAMKVSITGDQSAEVSVWMAKMNTLGAGMGLMDPYDQSNEGEGDKEPSGYAKGKILDLRPRWEQLITFFNSYPPPAECKPIADDFNRSLSEIPGMMGDLGDILNGASTDPEQALKTVKKIQNSSYGDIDRYFIRCDEKVSQICAKYNTHKWFNIKGDVMAGGMIGKFGSLGGGGALGGPSGALGGTGGTSGADGL